MFASVMDSTGNSHPSYPRQAISPVQSPDPVADAAAANGGDGLSFNFKLMTLCATYNVSLDLDSLDIILEEKTPCLSPSPNRMQPESPIQLAAELQLELDDIDDKDTYIQSIVQAYNRLKAEEDTLKAEETAVRELAQKQQLMVK